MKNEMREYWDAGIEENDSSAVRKRHGQEKSGADSLWS
jgi:hypothetical protein